MIYTQERWLPGGLVTVAKFPAGMTMISIMDDGITYIRPYTRDFPGPDAETRIFLTLKVGSAVPDPSILTLLGHTSRGSRVYEARPTRRLLEWVKVWARTSENLPPAASKSMLTLRNYLAKQTAPKVFPPACYELHEVKCLLDHLAECGIEMKWPSEVE